MSAMLSMEPLPPLPDHLTWPREPLVDELHTLSLLDLPSWLVVDPAPEPWLVVDSAPKPVLTAIPKAPRTRRHSVKARRHVPLPPPPSPLALEVAKLLAARRQLDYALFFPSQASHDELIRLLALTRDTMDIAVYVLSSRVLVNAILAAHGLGVTVRVVCDSNELNSQHCLAHLLTAVGIDVRAAGNQHGSLHHKYTILDGKTLLSGSINWLMSGMERNHENLIVRKGGALPAEFETNFSALWFIWSHEWVSPATQTPARRFGF